MAVNGNGNGHEGKFSHAMSSGLVATIAWVLVLVIYCVFRFSGIEDPLLGQAFLLLTGAWVGNLTLAQGKKQARVEEKVDVLTEQVVVTTKKAEEASKRADAAEKRVRVPRGKAPKQSATSEE